MGCRLATIPGQPATSWLPYKRVAKGSLLLHPTSSQETSNFLSRVKEVLLLTSSLAISLHNLLFPSTHSANANANTYGARYFLLCVVVASVVQDEEVVEWSEASALV
jgi:hypothetical protein